MYMYFGTKTYLHENILLFTYSYINVKTCTEIFVPNFTEVNKIYLGKE